MAHDSARPGATGRERHATPRVRFDRDELAGAFGDVGTDLPLLIALVVSCGLDAAAVCIMFGLLQVATGLVYGLPMPVQPLKAMATIMLAERLAPGTFFAAGLVIGATMLVIAVSGGLDVLARIVPKEVVRGLQVGLGISLASVALKQYAAVDGAAGYGLALASLVFLLLLRGQRRVPAPLVVMGLGALYAVLRGTGPGTEGDLVGLQLPVPAVPSWQEVVDGALLLALPQLPLSIANSLIATSQTTADLFPDRAVPVRKLGVTYGVMNLVGPWFGGVPVCHGCGGLVGFHLFGARTGGAPVIYGSFYLLLGLVFAPGFAQVVKAFPMPVLGVVLLFEGLGLTMLIRDVAGNGRQLWVALAVAAAVTSLPYGYVVGLVVGTAVVWAVRRGWVVTPGLELPGAPPGAG